MPPVSTYLVKGWFCATAQAGRSHREAGHFLIGRKGVLHEPSLNARLPQSSERRRRGLATHPVSRWLARRLLIELAQNFPVEVLPPSCFERCGPDAGNLRRDRAFACYLVAQVTTRFRPGLFWCFSRSVSVSVLPVFPTSIRRPAGSVGDRSLRRSLTWRAHMRPERDLIGSYSLPTSVLNAPKPHPNWGAEA